MMHSIMLVLEHTEFHILIVVFDHHSIEWWNSLFKYSKKSKPISMDITRKHKEAGLKGLASLVDEILIGKEFFMFGNVRFEVTKARVDGKSIIYRCCDERMLKIKGIAKSDENKYGDKDKIITDTFFYCQNCGKYHYGLIFGDVPFYL